MLRLSTRLTKSFAQQKFLTPQAYLHIRNSQTYQLTIPIRNQQRISIQIPKKGTLNDITQKLKQKLQLTDVSYFCNQKIMLPSSTLVDVLINRYFYIQSDQYFMFPVEGQMFDYGKSDEVVEGIVGLQLPAVTKRQIQNYLSRVNQWVQFYTGKNILDQGAKVDSKTMAKIFVQSAIDPQPQQRLILQVQDQWEKTYWKVDDLKRKKKEADQICLSKVRRKMSWGLVFIGGNIGFIWSGTYIFYSWDIMQPLAYFVSSLGAIILAAQFFKLGRPYTHYIYQQYLMQKFAPQVYKQIGFNLQDLLDAQKQLIQLQAELKNYYLKRL